jgi:hypothetical protein
MGTAAQRVMGQRHPGGPGRHRRDAGAARVETGVSWASEGSLHAPDELDTLRAWHEDGAPEGDPANAAPLPDPFEGDLEGVTQTLAPSQPYTTSGMQDEQICFVLDPAIAAPSWLTGLQVVPGNLEVAHHVVVMVVPPESAPAMLEVHYHPTGFDHAPDLTTVNVRMTTQQPPKNFIIISDFGNASAPPELLPGPNDPNGVELYIPANVAGHTESMTFPSIFIWASRPPTRCASRSSASSIERASARARPGGGAGGASTLRPPR